MRPKHTVRSDSVGCYLPKTPAYSPFSSLILSLIEVALKAISSRKPSRIS